MIVPVFNGASTIRKCLELILVQDYPSELFEIIVIDNNSSDNTVEIIKNIKNVNLVYQTEFQNSYATRNYGISLAKGRIIVFTDTDCLPEYNWLTEIIKPFENSEIQAVGGMVLDVEPTNDVERFLQEINPLRDYTKSPDQYLKLLITANLAVRKSAIDKINGFRARLYTGADIDFAWRLQMKLGDCIDYNPQAIVYHKHRSSLKGLFRQYRRHGFGEIVLDAIYQNQPGYPRTRSFQRGRFFRQLLALITYVGSFIIRIVKYPGAKERYHFIKPILWFTAESGNVWGKLQALWATRFLTANPLDKQWIDPGG